MSGALAYVFVDAVDLLLDDEPEGVQRARNDVHGVEPLHTVGLLRQVVEKAQDGVADTEVVAFLRDFMEQIDDIRNCTFLF